MNSYVLDACVAAKWFLPPAQEPLTAEARNVLREFSSGNCSLSVPDLFWPEIANILWKAARGGRIPAASCEPAITTLLRSGIRTAPSQALVEDALAIALAYQRPVYDCEYVALALQSGSPLLTADERLANALSARFPIRWLGALA